MPKNRPFLLFSKSLSFLKLFILGISLFLLLTAIPSQLESVRLHQPEIISGVVKNLSGGASQIYKPAHPLGMLILPDLILKSVNLPAAVASTAPNSQESLRIQAQALTDKGREQLAIGKAEIALKFWEEATRIYALLADEEGIAGSRINQSIALQALGKYRQACQIVLIALNLGYNEPICSSSTEGNQTIPEQPKTSISTIGLRSLGDVLQVIGKLEKSLEALQQSLDIAKFLKSDSDISAALLSLGKTEQAFYNREKELYNRTELPSHREQAKAKAIKALELYQMAAQEFENTADDTVLSIQAKLNQLSLSINLFEWLKTEEKIASNLQIIRRQIQNNIKLQINNLIQEPSWLDRLTPNSKTNSYIRIKLGRSLMQIKHNNDIDYVSWAFIEQLLKATLDQAESIGDRRTISYTLGYLGQFYELTEQLSNALDYTQKALFLAQYINAADIAFEWEWQLGRIYQAKGLKSDAIASYTNAVTTLDRVRKNLLSINPELLFSFLEEQKPIYQELIELYLENPTETNLKKVLEVNDKLQVAELQNFIQCEREDLVKIDEVLEKLDTRTNLAFIYTIFVKDRLEVIVQLPQKSPYHYRVSASLTEVEETIRELRSSLETSANEWVLEPAQKLYRWLVEPAKNILPESGTLVFVSDISLQKIPMAVLHDGQQYLVEKYDIALALSSRLRSPKFLPPKQLKVLVAGTSEGTSFSTPPGFSPLPNINDELNQLKQKKISVQELRDREFTKKRFQTEVNASNLPVIHLATHGLFSSDPNNTFILAYDTPINIKQLDGLFRSRIQGSPNPIELLVLSACQTAEGDKRAALGMAGVAVQAGARSTLASLWQVSDRSTVDFMSLFYQALKEGKTKAQALRFAQQTFLQKYDHPYYWAAFVLVGNWL